MDIKTALIIVKRACAKFVGTLEEHSNIQTAIKTIELAFAVPPKPLEPKKPSIKEEEKKPNGKK